MGPVCRPKCLNLRSVSFTHQIFNGHIVSGYTVVVERILKSPESTHLHREIVVYKNTLPCVLYSPFQVEGKPYST